MKGGQIIALFALLAVLASPALLSIRLAVAQDVNLLQNPGFEGGIGDEWLVHGGDLTRVAHAGGFAAEFTASTTGWFCQVVQVQPGATYTFSGYAQNNDPDIAWVYLQIRWFSSTDGYGAVGVPIVSTDTLTSDGSYHFLTTLAVPAPDAAHSARAECVVKLISPGTATACFDDMSFSGPAPTSTPSPSPSPSPGPPSSPASVAEGDVVINEVQYDPPQKGAEEHSFEWVELFNRTEETIHLEGWRIRDNSDSDLIPGLTLPPHGFAVVAATDSFYVNFPTFSGTIVFVEDGLIGNGLANDGDRIILEDSQGGVIDALSYGDDTSQSPHCPDVASAHSLERSPPGGEFSDNPDPTPGYGLSPGPTPTETPVETETPTETPPATPPGDATPEPSEGSGFPGVALRGVGIALAIVLFGIFFWVGRRRGSRK